MIVVVCVPHGVFLAVGRVQVERAQETLTLREQPLGAHAFLGQAACNTKADKATKNTVNFFVCMVSSIMGSILAQKSDFVKCFR